MSKLIIINGPCGVGKSTVTNRLHQEIPLSFLFDIDAQMRFISHYREYPEERRKTTLALADSVINTMLTLNRDVVVDKMIFNKEIVDSYYKIAAKHEAEIKEIILWAPKEVIMKRADERGWRKDGLLTPEKCEMFWDKMDEFRKKRPQAVIIDTSNQTEEQTYQEVKQKVNIR